VSREARLRLVLGLNLVLVAGLIAVGLRAHSVGVFAEGVDYLADAAAIGVSLLAIKLAARPPTARRPQGYPRATTFAALVNAGWLLLLCLLVAVGALVRLLQGTTEVHGLPVLIVSGVAALVMLGGALILGRDTDYDLEDNVDVDDGDLNMRAVLLDTAGDAAAATGVAVAGAVILATHGWYWLDPLVALVLAVVIGVHAALLLRRIMLRLRRSEMRVDSDRVSR